MIVEHNLKNKIIGAELIKKIEYIIIKILHVDTVEISLKENNIYLFSLL